MEYSKIVFSLFRIQINKLENILTQNTASPLSHLYNDIFIFLFLDQQVYEHSVYCHGVYIAHDTLNIALKQMK